jgi:hypothetical protein
MENTHALHLEPAWGSRADFVIDAELSDPLQGKFEQLRVRKVSINRFEICCIPFFLYDLALGDIVETPLVGKNRYVVRRVAQPSGRGVYRVVYKSQNQADCAELIDQTATMVTEWSSENLMAIDVPDLRSGRRLHAALCKFEQLGHIEFEIGKEPTLGVLE